MKEIAMSQSNPASNPAHAATPDAQTIVALLQGLLPLLMRIQQPETSAQVPFQNDPRNLGAANATLDHQAAVNLVEDMTANSLRTLALYLETHAGRHAELQGCVGLVTQGVHCFAARNYAQAFDLIWQAYRMLAALQAINPQLPPLRSVNQTHPASSPPTTSVH
jgi:hypothetical protein